MSKIKVIKKDGTVEDFNIDKIYKAIEKSALRVMKHLKEDEKPWIKASILENISGKNSIPVKDIHLYVEKILSVLDDEIAKSYKDYRNYKTSFVSMLDNVYQESQKIRYIGDKENSNSDSTLVSTKRSLIYSVLNKEMYKKFFLTVEEIEAIKKGYIYIHDMNARLDSINCCLADVGTILKDGFEMGNIWYNEPKTLDVAFDVLGDIIFSMSSQQYGGFTVPEVDTLLKPYAEKSYLIYKNEFFQIADNFYVSKEDNIIKKAEEYAIKKLWRDMEQGFQGIEYKLNTVGSSRGDYSFVTFTFGLGKTTFEKMLSKTCLRVRRKGQGKRGFKKPVLFPKLVFLYDEKLHGEGKELGDVFDEAVKCSQSSMYPDFLSLTGDGYVPDIYKEYGKIISPMGCRAFLSPYYEKGGIKPINNEDNPIFIGRANLGAISLHLPMIYAKAKRESKNFYDVLDYYLEIIRGLHLRTYDYLAEMKASTNPLGFCEGGFYKGNLKPDDKIEPVIKSFTLSFGITALNELQQIHNQKSLVRDGEFALEVMEYIKSKVEEFKRQDGKLYAIYGSPAESLCSKQVQQFRKEFGIIKNVSDREYVSNSFHCHVSEDINPIQKQDLEKRFWNYFNGGKIQYVKYPISYNFEAIKSLVRRAMELGFYEGVNLSLSYCNECGYEELNMDTCPQCGSNDLTKIDRMNGYLSYSRVKGESRLNDGKMAEIRDRVSM